MSIETLLKKLAELKIEGIEESDIEAIKGIGKTTVPSEIERQLKDSKAAQSRILEEKKKLAEKLAEQEAAMEEMKSGGLTEIQKAQKELEKTLKLKEKLEAELNEAKTKMIATERSYQLEKIGSRIKFLDTIPSDIRSYAVTSAFKEVEDLNDTDSIDKVLESFTESHKGILASDTEVRGSGSGGSGKVVSHSSGKSPDKMSDSERAKSVLGKARERSMVGIRSSQ